ncbi:MAG TPA: sulfurtransferase [Gemmatimonadaceae bacterium]|jgi:thiosulfate/3-mercaptopyruvate sulfurtransferase
MPFTTLISTAELADETANPSWVVVDCRFDLANVDWGHREYLARHIPRAVYAHLDADLSGAKTGTNGRHPLPDADALRHTLSRFGVARDTQVVAYDEGSGMYAARLWWLLRWMGHDAVAVLDGGFAKWTAEDRPTITGEEVNARREFSGEPRAEMTVDAARVESLRSDGAWRLVDARAPERFRGDVEPIDRVGGHIPGAVNRFFKSNLNEAGVFRSPSELRQQLSDLAAGVTPDHIVNSCGSGVTACHNLLALEHAGMGGAKLYPGSWSEWSSDPNRPVGRGDT